MDSHDLMCAFCGAGIDDSGVDPCAILVIAKWRAPEEQQQEQQFFTHAECLRARLHPDAARVAFSLDEDWDGNF
ncbi:MAG: hypothetical protein ACXVX8_02705 [Blastococcus sp.]